MIRRIRLALVIVVCVVLQTTLFTHLRIDGIGPDIGLVAVLAVAYEDGADTGAIFGFLMGLAMDLFLTTPLGLSAMSFAITGYAVGVFQAGMVRTTPWLAPILGGVGGLFGGLVFITVGRDRRSAGVPVVREPADRDHRRDLRRRDRPPGVPDRAPGGPAGGSVGHLAGPRVMPGSGRRPRDWEPVTSPTEPPS